MASLKTIIVPVDGSDLSNRAIPVAAAIATAAGASMAIVSVARYEGALAGTTKRVREARHLVPEGIPVEVDVVVSPSPVVALLERAAASASVLCLATHDRRPVSATLLDSVGSQIIEHARRPLIIVGPAGDGSRLGRDVVVALDGVHDAASLLSTAMTWAALLDAPLRIVTVYEPVLPDLRRPGHFTRRHGPPTDPDAYLDDLALRLRRGPDDRIETVALADPVSVADGVAQHLSDRPALLLVAGAPRGTQPLRPGVLRELVHHVSIPVLVVPKAQLEPDEALVDAAERGEP